MTTYNRTYKRSKTTEFLSTLNNILYLCGFPNYWIDPVNFSDRFTKIFDVISSILHVTGGVSTCLLLSAYITQDKLNPKQKADRFVLCFTHTIAILYVIVFLYHRDKIREILYKLLVVLKEEHNDEGEEQTLIKKFKMYAHAFIGSSVMTLLFYGVFGVYEASKGLPFITVITPWPDVADRSTTAEIARILFYIYWCILLLRICGAFLILLIMLIALSQQYRNLQSYFYTLNDIFDEYLEQVAKEDKYEKAFIRGVKMHTETIWCLNECKHVCKIVFDVEIMFATITMMILLSEIMNPDRDIQTVLSDVPTAITSLIVTGYFMWNAGDITVEALLLPDAMYGSGWQNCCGTSSIRIRKLVVLSMAVAKQPVTLKAFGIVELSYSSYLSILKVSHSIFSVFY